MAIVSTGQFTITDANDAVSARLSNEFSGVSTNADGSGGDFTGCSTTITVNQGLQDITANGWSITAVPSAGVSGTLVGQTYTVTGLSVDSGYVDLLATHSNGDTLSKRFTVTKVKKGEAGALITLVPTSQGFFFKDGVAEPSAQTIGFMVVRQNTEAKVTFEASDGVSLLTDEGYLDAAQYADGIYGQGQGDICYLSVADFGNRKQVTVTAKAGYLASSVTILRLDESSAEPGATRNVFRGALSYGQAYLVGDTVIADGYGWSCIQAHFSEAANRPPPYPATENTWWALASVKGADTLNAVLSNEAFVFSAGSDGAVSSYTGSGTAVRVYEGAEELLYDGVGTSSGTWKVATSATNITVGSLTDSGTYLTVGQHSGVANGTDTASITYTITGKTKAGADFTLMKVQTFAKGKAGATGATGRYGLNFAEAKSMFTDPTFQGGSNSVGVYNNAGGGAVTHTREARQTDSPFTDSGFNMKISNTGAASPGIGGFIHSFISRASAVFVQRIVAKIPVGYTIEQATNHIGDGATNEWITPQAGTGKFEEYILVRRCGATGTFSGSGYIYLNGAAGSAGAPVNWYVAYAATYDFTSVGFGAITAVLSNETHTIPTDSAGNNGNFTGSATTVTIYNGTSDDSANWTVAATPTAGVTGSLAGKTYTVTAMTVDTGYVDLVASRSGYASVTKRFTLTKSKGGATGAAGANATFVKIVGCNYNAELAGFPGYGFTASNGAAITTKSIGHRLVVWNPATNDYHTPSVVYNTYGGGTASLVAALNDVPNGMIVCLLTQDASSCDAALRTVLQSFGSSMSSTWAPSRVTHVFIGMKGAGPGQAYEATSTAADASGIVTLQAYYTASGLVLNGATGAQGPSVLVTPDRVTTFTATDGTLDASQADIVFTASVSGVASPTYVWSFSGFQTAPTNSGTATQTITAAQFGTAKSAIVTCMVSGTYTDKVTIVRLEKSTAAAGATVGANSSNLAAGVGTNLIRNSDMRDGLSPFAIYSYSVPGLPALSLTAGAGFALLAMGIAKLSYTGTVTSGQFMDGVYGEYMPVIPGQRLEVQARLACTNCTGIVAIAFFDSSGASLGAVAGSAVTASPPITTLDSMPISALFTVVPANATTALIFVRGTCNGTANPSIYFTRMYMGEAGPAQNQLSSWSAGRGIASINAGNVGTYIANAAIGAAQIGSIALTGVGNFSVKTGVSGARMEMDSRAIKVFDASGVLRVQLGDLSV